MLGFLVIFSSSLAVADSWCLVITLAVRPPFSLLVRDIDDRLSPPLHAHRGGGLERRYSDVTLLAGEQSPCRTLPTGRDISPVVPQVPGFETEMSTPRDQYGRRIVFPIRTVENVSVRKRQRITLESYSSSPRRDAELDSRRR